MIALVGEEYLPVTCPDAGVNLGSDLFGSDPFWRGWLEPICIGCGSADFFAGVEWISRLRSSKSASTMPNIVVAKPSKAVTKPNIVIVGKEEGPKRKLRKVRGV